MSLKRAFIILILFFFSKNSFSQGNWGGGVDLEPLHFGFTFQYIGSEYKIIKAPSWRDPYIDPDNNDTETLKSIRSALNPGFGLGFVSDLFITPNLNLRFTPTLVFADRVIDYEFESGKTYEQDAVVSPEGFTRRAISSTMVEFPISLKLKSDRKNNFRAYLIGGAKYGIDIASKKKADDAGNTQFNKYLKNQKGILSYEAGIGFDLYFEFFKLSPEIKLSNSVNSVLRRDAEPYSSALDKLFLRNFIFSLYFE